MGGLFAMVASAFTKAPMENAINGMAGAINAIKDGNEANYQRAYDAFKTNVKLADQRFKTQHELYSDALGLSSVDMAASDAKLRNAAVKFGDQHVLMLADHGMVKEIYELQEARAKAHEQMMESAEKTDLHTIRRAAVDSLKKAPPSTGDPVQDKMMLAAQIQRIYDGNGKYGTAEQEAVGRFMQANMNKSPQEIADGLANIHEKFVAKAPNIEGYRQAVAQEEEANGGVPLSPERLAQLQQMFGLTPRPTGTGAGGLPKNNSQLKIAEMEEIKAAAAKEGKTLSNSEAEDEWAKHQAKVKMETATLTGNKADDLLRKRDLAVDMIADSNKNIEFLQNHKWPAGVLGKVMRGEELVGNIAGTTDTERKDFYRRVMEMKMVAAQLLADQTGRPLKAMQDEVDGVVAGIAAGDTGPNSISAYRSLIDRLEKRINDWNARLTKSPAENAREGGASSAPATEKSGKRPLWEIAPVDSTAPGKGSSASEPPPVEGARKAPDGNWYVDDPGRPGKFLKVMVS
jgi:hypothetical protein